MLKQALLATPAKTVNRSHLRDFPLLRGPANDAGLSHSGSINWFEDSLMNLMTWKVNQAELAHFLHSKYSAVVNALSLHALRKPSASDHLPLSSCRVPP